MMHAKKNRNVTYLTFEGFEKFPFLYHAFSTRLGGVSENEFSSMNLSFYTNDKKENILKNFEIFCNAVNIDIDSLVLTDQNHTNNVIRIKAQDKGKGINRDKTWENVDGLITNVPGITLVTFYADCVPLYFFDPKKGVVATAHAGWKGTVSKIAQETIKAMVNEYECNPSDIHAGIGPCIEKDCYEISQNEANHFFAMDKKIIENNITTLNPDAPDGERKYYVDLKEINKNIIICNGVLPENIELANICTKCNHEWLFSHRGANGKRGGMVAMIGIKEE